MKLPSLSALLILTFTLTLAIGPGLLAKDPPPFPGQPHLNAALKHLGAAKEKASTDANAALNDLQAAASTLAHAIHNKGTYQNIARERTAQAIQYLQDGDAEKALHKIDEAIDAVNHGGETGEH
jgi:hypothetical protein